MILIQFKELLRFVIGSMQAGYSIENSFINSISDMNELYGKNAVMVKELFIIKNGLDNNRTIVELLMQMSKRLNIEEVSDFATIIAVGKKSGGNTIKIMSSYMNVIEEKMSVLQELDTMISSVKYEQRIMNVIPFAILGYVDLTCRGFFNLLYHNPFGIIVMTICLVIYILSVYLSHKISAFEI